LQFPHEPGGIGLEARKDDRPVLGMLRNNLNKSDSRVNHQVSLECYSKKV
jgi:hypothetical protein